MKINKLYTLSQFVDKITSKIKAEGVGRFVDDNLELIQDYNEFLKQPLKKEMFVNAISRPIRCEDDFIGGKYTIDRLNFEDGERLVIFEDVEILPYSNQTVLFDIFVNKKFIARTRGDETWAFNNNTLSDLAEMTKGELTLRNVEI